jgi:hypothetical protein
MQFEQLFEQKTAFRTTANYAGNTTGQFVDKIWQPINEKRAAVAVRYNMQRERKMLRWH